MSTDLFELENLERKIATESAESLIENVSLMIMDRGEEWQDLRDEEAAGGLPDCITEAVRYLELRGLLKRHPVEPLVVQLLEEK